MEHFNTEGITPEHVTFFNLGVSIDELALWILQGHAHNDKKIRLNAIKQKEYVDIQYTFWNLETTFKHYEIPFEKNN